MNTPRIRTTTVGSYPVPAWLQTAPSEQAVIDATCVVVGLQRRAGIDLPTDGELYRFDMNHPDTNGMIDYFVRPLSGVRSDVGMSDGLAYRRQHSMAFRAKPAGVVEGSLGEGGLNLNADLQRAVSVAGKNLKFTVTSPYMLARTLLDNHHRSQEDLLMSLAHILAAQVRELDCACVQIDEANIPGNPEDGPMAARAMNVVLDAIPKSIERAVHFCFGNYGGQTIQGGTWSALTDFLNDLHCDHLVLELAHRPAADLDALKAVKPEITLGLGVVDVKINHVETPDEIAKRIEVAEKVLGENRVGWVHPDCGFWMLKRSIADRKIRALVEGRDLYLA